MSLPPLLAVVGPTAAGKSAVAVALALEFGGEIVNADPQQFYRGLDIGTAKPDAADRTAVKHHLLDINAADGSVGLGLFQRLARAALDEIWARRRLPVLVGGSGQYIWGFLEGWTVPAVPPDLALRARLEHRARVEGNQILHDELASVDPAAAAAIHVNNVRRVVRALEVYQRTGRPISACQARAPLAAETLVIGLRLPRDELDRRIDERTRRMFGAGFVEEVRNLLAAGLSPQISGLNSIGYRQVVSHLRGEITLAEAEASTARDTRRLARRQMAWFRPGDERIQWFHTDEMAQIVALAEVHTRGLLRSRAEGGLGVKSTR